MYVDRTAHQHDLLIVEVGITLDVESRTQHLDLPPADLDDKRPFGIAADIEESLSFQFHAPLRSVELLGKRQPAVAVEPHRSAVGQREDAFALLGGDITKCAVAFGPLDTVREQQVLRDLSCVFPEGKTTCIRGRSGHIRIRERRCPAAISADRRCHPFSSANE